MANEQLRRLALRAGNIAEAAKHDRVFELTPVAAK
jgi:hypothetical protein